MIAINANPEEEARAMARLLRTDPEAWCSMKGLMSQLQLPLRPTIEIELDGEAGRWMTAHTIVLHDGGITFYSGANGSTMQHVFRWSEVPRWRLTPRSRPIFPLGHLR